MFAAHKHTISQDRAFYVDQIPLQMMFKLSASVLTYGLIGSQILMSVNVNQMHIIIPLNVLHVLQTLNQITHKQYAHAHSKIKFGARH